jgi:heme-degrading monooxygenase HmoA
MLKLVAHQPGSPVSIRCGEDGLGLTVAYWAHEESVTAWRGHPTHALTRADGRELWILRCTRGQG